MSGFPKNIMTLLTKVLNMRGTRMWTREPGGFQLKYLMIRLSLNLFLLFAFDWKGKCGII